MSHYQQDRADEINISLTFTTQCIVYELVKLD